MTFDDNQKFNAPMAPAPALTPAERRANFKFSLICKSKCKDLALRIARDHRPANKFNRVGEDFLIACEGALRNFIASRVKMHPSKGKTLK